MVDNSNMPHPKCLGSQKNPGTEPKTCEKEPKLGFEYLPTSKTLHCVRTACALRAHCVHGIPLHSNGVPFLVGVLHYRMYSHMRKGGGRGGCGFPGLHNFGGTVRCSNQRNVRASGSCSQTMFNTTRRRSYEGLADSHCDGRAHTTSLNFVSNSPSEGADVLNVFEKPKLDWIHTSRTVCLRPAGWVQ